jgi:hypothetical protein
MEFISMPAANTLTSGVPYNEELRIAVIEEYMSTAATHVMTHSP